MWPSVSWSVQSIPDKYIFLHPCYVSGPVLTQKEPLPAKDSLSNREINFWQTTSVPRKIIFTHSSINLTTIDWAPILVPGAIKRTKNAKSNETWLSFLGAYNLEGRWTQTDISENCGKFFHGRLYHMCCWKLHLPREKGIQDDLAGTGHPLITCLSPQNLTVSVMQRPHSEGNGSFYFISFL